MTSSRMAFGSKPSRSRRSSIDTVSVEIKQAETLETRALLAFDFGDAPDSTARAAVQDYQTRLASNGPRHQLSSSQTSLFLGASVDADTGVNQSISANLDDQFTSGGRNDEDGVLNVMDLNGTVGAGPRVTLSATNTTGKDAKLYGWIDFNHNGLFENATERAWVAVPSNSIGGRFSLSFPTAPVGSAGTTYARFRLSTDVAAANSTGAAADGEVEDYQFVIQNRVRMPVEVIKSVRIGNEINGGPVTTGADLFGAASAAIGDLDGDGVTDMVVGAPQDDEGGTDRGAITIMFLKPDGTVKQTVKIASALNGGPVLANGDAFGTSIASLGDLNGDGIVDLAVGATADDTGGTDRGAVYIIQLNSDGTAKSTSKIASTTGGGPVLADGDGFGIVASLGDFDGDGIVDIVVGAPFADAGGIDLGEIHLLKLRTDGTVKNGTKIQNAATWNPTVQDNEFFGQSFTNLGDLDGDGVVDLAVTSNVHTNYNWSAAPVSLQMMRLNSDGTVKNHRVLTNPIDTYYYGTTPSIRGVAAVGDVNGDGVNDILFAVDNVYQNSGMVGWLVLACLNPDGSIRSYSKIGSGATGSSGFANSALIRSSMTPLGDLDGDGSLELAIGVSNDVFDGSRIENIYIQSLLSAKPNTDLPPVPVLHYVAPLSYPLAIIWWSDNSAATGYDIWLRNLSTGITLLNSVNNSGSAFQLPAEFGIGRYEFYVRAKNEVGKSAWSKRLAFTSDGQVTVNETPDGMQTRPTLSWQPLPGAVSYDIWLNDTRTPLAPLVNIRTSGSLTSFVPGSDLADASYRFQVRGVGADGTLSQWSPADIFVVKTTIPIVRVSKEFTHRPILEWTTIPGAASYDVWINAIPSGVVRFNTNIVVETNFFTPETVFTPETDLAPGNYRAWIRPVAADGSRGVWSPARDFKVGAIPQISAKTFQVLENESFYLPLPEIPGAEYVDVWIDDPAPDPALPETSVGRYGFSQSIFQAGFATQGKYRFRIRPVAADGTTGEWSSSWILTVRIRPYVYFPIDETASGSQSLLAWRTIPYAKKYEIQLVDSDTSAVTSIEANPSDSSLNLATLPLGRLMISVRAVSVDGTKSHWSAPQSYFNRPSPIILLPTVSTANTTPKLQWTPVTGAFSYDLVVRNRTTNSVQFFVRGLQATSYTSPNLPLGNYEVWVIANGANGLRGEWASEQFVVIPVPKPVLMGGDPAYYNNSTGYNIRWIGVPDADHYDLWISDSHAIIAARELDVPHTSYVLTKTLPRNWYRIWVRAVYADGTYSPWSNSESFTVL